MDNALLCGTPALLTLMDESEVTMQTRIEDMHDVQMHLRVSSPVPFGVPVKIEGDNVLVLGDVTHCIADKAGFLAGVTVRHTLALPDLLRLNNALEEEEDHRFATAGARD